MIEHFQQAGRHGRIELPVQAFFDDRFLVAKGLTQPLGLQHHRVFRARAALWHAGPVQGRGEGAAWAGIEVILDVVYNHTGEGDQWGPTLCHRGFDNASYYRLTEGGRFLCQ